MTASDGNEFVSSDSVRSAEPLRHLQTLLLDRPVELEAGGVLEQLTIAYESYGKLNAARDNAVLICHAISGDSHVARHDDGDSPGWWDCVVGPGRAIDTNRYFVICSNVIGGCRGSTGPNFTDPGTGRPYGADFPVVTVGDMVAAQAKLIDHLGIDRLLAVVGGSLGGFQTLEWATKHPDRVAGCIALATSPRLTNQALAFDVVGRNAIIRDPFFSDGQYYGKDKPEVGLAIARMLAHITYLSVESMEEKFNLTRYQPRDIATAFEKKFSVGSYLAHQGHKFVDRFDANSYVTLSTAMDLFDFGDSPEKLRKALAPSTCAWLLISFSSDWLYPPSQSRDLVDALIAEGKPLSYCNVETNCGHDSFLLEDDIDSYGAMIASFLGIVSGEASAPEDLCAEQRSYGPTSIFNEDRLDYEIIMKLVPQGASVLDLGCGNGELMSRLVERGSTSVMGVELDEKAVVACIARGLPVIHFDIDKGLAAFNDKHFDTVILSQTLQSIEDVSGTLREITRVGNRGIVSFPNFAFKPLREMFYREGRLPKQEGGYSYEWHNTPNRRFPSIRDFQELCTAEGIAIEGALYLNTKEGRKITEDPNLNADIGIFVIRR